MKRKYPLPDMKVGQSVLVPDHKTLPQTIWNRGDALGMKFKTRRVGEQRRIERIA